MATRIMGTVYWYPTCSLRLILAIAVNLWKMLHENVPIDENQLANPACEALVLGSPTIA